MNQWQGQFSLNKIITNGLAGFLWIEQRKRELHVHGIILLPEFRGQGRGASIFKGLQEEFEGRIDVIELGVRSANDGAIRFYERIGFEITKSIDEIGFRVLRRALKD